MDTNQTDRLPATRTGAARQTGMDWTSDAIAEIISRIGIRYLALVPGASFRGLHDSIVNYLGNQSPELIVCLHEGYAVSIADGYGRATDQPMAVAVHSNVGLMHGSMAIYNAWCARVPMLIIGATGPVDAHKRRPWIDWIHTSKDQASIVRPYIKWDDQPASAESCIELLLRANQIARTAPAGPVYICLDAHLQEQKLDPSVTIPPVERFQPAPMPAADSDTIAAILAAMAKARLPLLLIGRGSRSQEDWDRRVRLAEAIGAAVITTFHNASCFPTEHPLHVAAPCGDKVAPQEIELLKQADLIISLDWHDLAGFLRARLGTAQTQQPAEATIIHCSPDSYVTNGWSMDHQALPAADIPVLAHPDRLVGQLLDALPTGAVAAPRAALAAFEHWTSAKQPALPAPTKNGMAMRDMAVTIESFFAGRAITYARLPIGWPSNVGCFTGPLDYMGKDAGGAVGTGPAHTVGIALALKGKGRLVLGVMGDGDFLMGSNAIWTAVQMKIPMLVIVANNRAFYNDVVHQETVARQRGRPVENRWVGQNLGEPAPDIAGMARAQGLTAEGPIADRDALLAALQRAASVVEAGGQYLLDVHIDPAS